MDGHRRLVVGGGGEHLAFAGGNGGVALYQPGHHPAQGLDAQRKRGDVQQQHVLDVAHQHAALDAGAQRHHLVGVHPAVGLLVEHLLDNVLDLGHPGHAAH